MAPPRVCVEASLSSANKIGPRPITERSQVSRQIEIIVKSKTFRNYSKELLVTENALRDVFSQQMSGTKVEHVTTVPVVSRRGALLKCHIIILTRTHLFYYLMEKSKISTSAEMLQHMRINTQNIYEPHGELKEVLISVGILRKGGEHFGLENLMFRFDKPEGLSGSQEFMKKFWRFRMEQ